MWQRAVRQQRTCGDLLEQEPTARPPPPPSGGLAARHRRGPGCFRVDRATTCRQGPTRAAAFDLYAGEHWSVVRRLQILAAQRDAQVGVLSVGAMASSRSPWTSPPTVPTFTAGHADEVASSKDAAQWREALGQWPGPAEEPLILAELAGGNPARASVATSPIRKPSVDSQRAATRWVANQLSWSARGVVSKVLPI